MWPNESYRKGNNCKYKYKVKIEDKMRSNDMRQALQGLYTMIGKEKKKSGGMI